MRCLNPFYEEDCDKPMRSMPREEAIAAYLDGQLSADERQAVEQILLDEPASRRWFAQMKRMRELLGELPRYRLEEDFAEGVLREAEQAMLRESRPAPDPAVDQRPPKSQPASNLPWLVGVATLSMATAAALLVALVLPQFKQPAGVHVAETAASPKPATAHAPAEPRAPEGEMLAVAPQPSQPSNSSDVRWLAPIANSETAAEEPAPAQALRKSYRRVDSVTEALGDAGNQDKDRAEQFGSESRDRLGRNGARLPSSGETIPAPVVPTDGLSAGDALVERFAHATNAGQAGLLDGSGPLLAANDVFVVCDLNPDTTLEAAFAKFGDLLDSQQIANQETIGQYANARSNQSAAGLAPGNGQKRVLQQAGPAVAAAPPKPEVAATPEGLGDLKNGVQKQVNQLGEPTGRTSGNSVSGNLEETPRQVQSVYVVNVSQQQLHAMLDAMADRPETFLTVQLVDLDSVAATSARRLREQQLAESELGRSRQDARRVLGVEQAKALAEQGAKSDANREIAPSGTPLPQPAASADPLGLGKPQQAATKSEFNQPETRENQESQKQIASGKAKLYQFEIDRNQAAPPGSGEESISAVPGETKSGKKAQTPTANEASPDDDSDGEQNKVVEKEVLLRRSSEETPISARGLMAQNPQPAPQQTRALFVFRVPSANPPGVSKPVPQDGSGSTGPSR